VVEACPVKSDRLAARSCTDLDNAE